MAAKMIKREREIIKSEKVNDMNEQYFFIIEFA